jgi:flavodoxin
VNTLIVVKSMHHQNTARVAQAMAEVLQAKLVTPEELTPADAGAYDVLGIGSGIYFGRFHRSLRQWIADLPRVPATRAAFVFSTSGLPFLQPLWHGPIRRRLSAKGYRVLGEFSCRGFDTVGPLWLIGGLNRRHPDLQDLARAADFSRGLSAGGNAVGELRDGFTPGTNR